MYGCEQCQYANAKGLVIRGWQIFPQGGINISGMVAPPNIPMINRAEPVLVNFPSPSNANGQIAGHIRELDNPSRAMKR